MKNRFLKIALSAALIASIIPAQAFADDAKTSGIYVDASQSDKAVETLVNLGIVAKRADGNYSLDTAVTNGEMLKLAAETLNGLNYWTKSVGYRVSDIMQYEKAPTWITPYMKYCVKFGIISESQAKTIDINAPASTDFTAAVLRYVFKTNVTNLSFNSATVTRNEVFTAIAKDLEVAAKTTGIYGSVQISGVITSAGDFKTGTDDDNGALKADPQKIYSAGTQKSLPEVTFENAQGKKYTSAFTIADNNYVNAAGIDLLGRSITFFANADDVKAVEAGTADTLAADSRFAATVGSHTEKIYSDSATEPQKYVAKVIEKSAYDYACIVYTGTGYKYIYADSAKFNVGDYVYITKQKDGSYSLKKIEKIKSTVSNQNNILYVRDPSPNASANDLVVLQSLNNKEISGDTVYGWCSSGIASETKHIYLYTSSDKKTVYGYSFYDGAEDVAKVVYDN